MTDESLLVKASKTGQPLLNEYTDALNQMLQRAPTMAPQDGPGDFILRTQSSTGYPAREFSANWRRLTANAVATGIERFTFHDLRGKSGSDSASLQEVSERLGHSSTAVTKRVYMRMPTRVKPVK